MTNHRTDGQWLFYLGAVVVGTALVELFYPLLFRVAVPDAWSGWPVTIFAGLTAAVAFREKQPRLRLAWALAALYFLVAWAFSEGRHATLRGVALPTLLAASGASFLWATVTTVSGRHRHVGVFLVVGAAIVRFTILHINAGYSR